MESQADHDRCARARRFRVLDIVPGKPMRNGHVELFNGRIRDELLNESLIFGIDHACSAIADRVEDFNIARPHSSLGCQTPGAFAEVLSATARDAMQSEGFALSPFLSPRAIRRDRNGRGSDRRRVRVQWRVTCRKCRPSEIDVGRQGA